MEYWRLISKYFEKKVGGDKEIGVRGCRLQF